MKPTRQTVIGMVCAKHPELLGQRYTPNHSCIECAKTRSRENYAARELTIGEEITVLRGEINRLKAENEALRKDADRYRWLVQNASVILDKKAAYQAETGFIKFDTMPGRRETESAIDAAMSNEGQS